MPVIRIHTFIKAPAQVVFDLARNIEVHTTSVAHSQERAIAGVTSGLINLGESVTWEAVHFGIRQHLTGRLTGVSRPYYFVDELERGIFKKLVHLHKFEKLAGGTTLMVDEFNYPSPLGWVGVAADKLFLEYYLRRFLLRRATFLKQQAEASGQPE
jgi:ligand-binding SRPBCC domain-containing protein